MKRKLFFWLEQLRITPQERVAVVLLLMALAVLSVLNLTLEQAMSSVGSRFPEIEREFKKRSAMLAAEEAELMKRYEPPETGGISVAGDTLPARNAGRESGENASEPVPVNINTATVRELQRLPGIGPVYARRIVEFRHTYGAFKTVDELIRIKGIGPKRLEKLKPLVRL